MRKWVGRIWDYEEAADVNTFINRNALDKGVSKLCLLNETDESLLLVASSELLVVPWKCHFLCSSP